ncbi:MAG: hypothetical protein ACLSVD_01530 [Eggerthellaceae bacterium]
MEPGQIMALTGKRRGQDEPGAGCGWLGPTRRGLVRVEWRKLSRRSCVAAWYSPNDVSMEFFFPG